MQRARPAILADTLLPETVSPKTALCPPLVQSDDPLVKRSNAIVVGLRLLTGAQLMATEAMATEGLCANR